jgi:quinohemoprotein ethanol dehydrogenase
MKDSSHLAAWDPVQKKEVWRVERGSPTASGVLATAGGLVFQGSTSGRLSAFQADSGKEVWSAETGASVTAAPIAYEVAGRQFIVVAAGAGDATALEGGQYAKDHILQNGTPRILAYALKGRAVLPAETPIPQSTSLPERFGTPKQLEAGKAHYARYCARCHGAEVINAGPLKSLTLSERLGEAKQWNLVVHAGLLASTGMVGFMAELKTDDVEAIRAYVVQRAHDLSPSITPSQ